jgi:DnaK suppressor protein
MAEARHPHAELRDALSLHRRQAVNDVRGRARARRGRDDQPTDVGDTADASDESMQTEIGMALLQMQSTTVARLDEALGRLDSGAYGICFECARQIPEVRLKALPCAVRCRVCEETREGDQAHARRLATQDSSPFSNAVLHPASTHESAPDTTRK